MITVGIDLAAEPKKTGVCEIGWKSGEAVVRKLEINCDDSYLLRAVDRAGKVGIDAPFGWPDEFVDAVSAHQKFAPWPGRDETDPRGFREHLTFRETDRFVRARARRPLSVSTDKIGVTAMRCAYFLDTLARRGIDVDRSGFGTIVEVYPAATLVRWNLPVSPPYKAAKGRASLEELVTRLRDQLPQLSFPQERDEHLFRENDDAFDALVSALVARAAALGLTDDPPEENRERARREGWIRLPQAGSLGRLTAPTV